MTISVLVVDDDQFVQRTITNVLSRNAAFECLGSCSNGAEAVAFVADREADVIIMDVRMPVMDGVEATRRILERHPRTRVIMWTSFEYDGAVAQAMAYGAAGFLLKNCDIHSLISTISAVHYGMNVMAPAVMTDWRNAGPAATSELPELGDRERRILALVCDGLSNPEIGRALHLSESSIKVHVSALMKKLGAANRVKLVLIAHNAGLDRASPPTGA